MIHDPKKRLISAPCFADRVFHHAVMNVCEPVLERYQIYDSYACRPGKGQFAAIERASSYARHHQWFLKMDVRKYFESISRAILWNRLTRMFREEAVLELWWQILDSWRPGQERGLPIGALTSQHLANFYLGQFDHEQQHRFPGGLSSKPQSKRRGDWNRPASRPVFRPESGQRERSPPGLVS